MSILCYVHRHAGGVPHFEVLADMSRDEAIERAAALLADRPDGERAELWADDELIFTVRHQAPPASGMGAGG
ncbi:MAG: hypothetical protein ABW360_03780 [Phenylobacterium sp.]